LAGLLFEGTSCSASSRRFKENIVPITGALAKVTQLEGVYFDWNEDYGGYHDIGLIAEDVGKVIPEVVIWEENGIDAKALNYEHLVALNIQAIKEIAEIIDFTRATTSVPSLVIDEDGNVGIGVAATSSLSYRLRVEGDVAAQSFVNVSSKDLKREIVLFGEGDYEKALSKIRDTNVATYYYKNEEICEDSETRGPEAPICQKRLGVIAEEAPVEILSADGKGVDIYKMTSMAWAGLKAQQKQIEQLKLDIDLLKTEANSNIQDLNNQDFFALVLSWFENLGVKFKSGITYLKDVVAESLTVGSSEKPTGITIYDEVTGDPYCIKMKSGQMVSVAGKCSEARETSGAGNVFNIEESLDTEPPVLTVLMNNPAEVPVGSRYSDYGVKVEDNVNDNLGYYVTVDGVEMPQAVIDTSAPATHEIIYTAVDQAGNVGTASRTVIVYDPRANDSIDSSTSSVLINSTDDAVSASTTPVSAPISSDSSSTTPTMATPEESLDGATENAGATPEESLESEPVAVAATSTSETL
jgi:hypothetical protein